MQIPVVRIGNSRGTRIPKSVIVQLYIQDKLELEVPSKGEEDEVFDWE